MSPRAGVAFAAVSTLWGTPYLYARDLTGLRDQLVARRLAPGEIVDGSPGPRSEMRVTDPDGYVLMVAQIDADTIVGEDVSGRAT